MAVYSPPPDGSVIEEFTEPDGRTYSWRQEGLSLYRGFAVAFLVLCSLGWLFGLLFAVTMLVLVPEEPLGFSLFLALWTGGWLFGGVVIIATFYRLLMPALPESITLKRDSFHYDSGTAPLITHFPSWYAGRRPDPQRALRRMFGRRRLQIEIAKPDLPEVVLERVGERQRLTFDHGADRIEIGEDLREPEREWLAEVIAEWQKE